MAGTAKPFSWRNAWYIHVTVNGKRTKRKLADTKTKAYDVWKASLKTATESKENPRFASVAIKWLALQDQRQVRGEVSESWLVRVSRTVQAFASDLKLKCMDMTPMWANAWAGAKSANYARTELAAIKQILRWAVSNKLLSHSPLAEYRLPSTQARQKILTVEEHNSLCRATNKKFKPLLRFAWLVGCRPGELRELKWEHLDADYSRAVYLEHKTAHSTGKPRVIYFPPRAQALLRKYRKTSESEFVFVNHRSKPWTKNAIVQRMDSLRETTGLDCVIYNYRHTWITRALLAGVDIATVAVLSGHSSVAMIAKTYGHLDQHSRHLSDAVAKIHAVKNE